MKKNNLVLQNVQTGENPATGNSGLRRESGMFVEGYQSWALRWFTPKKSVLVLFFNMFVPTYACGKSGLVG